MKLGGVFMMLAVLASAGAAQACGPQALGTARSVEIAPTAPLGLKTYPRTLALADKELVLTFDDGPLPATTTRVLDALKAECVQATFFVIGRNAAANPSVLRRALKDGHTIGHHSYTHPAITLRGLSEEAAKADIARGMEADDIAAYGAWSGAPKTPFFRFPGFADTPALNATLAAQGVTIFGADLWASDWQPMSADAQRALLLARIEKAGKGVVLMHDTRAQTADMLPALLRDLKARDYRIVHIAPGAAAAPLSQAPTGWRSETEAILKNLPAMHARKGPL